MYSNCNDDPATAAICKACEGFDLELVASAAATLLAQSCAQKHTDIRDALEAFEAHVADARHEIEINFTKVIRSQSQ